jgi:hypothetical protein
MLFTSVSKEPTVMFVVLEVEKVAVSPEPLGAGAAVQLALLLKLLSAGLDSHVPLAARARSGFRNNPLTM